MPDCEELRDCVEDPIPAHCEKFCLEKILRKATPEEKRLILGYSSATADAIFKAYNNDNIYIRNFDDLAKWLTQEQQNEILTKFRQINRFRLRYFQLPRSQREQIIAAIKNLGLDMNDEAGTSQPI